MVGVAVDLAPPGQGGEHSHEADQCGQQHQGNTDPVHAHEVLHLQIPDPHQVVHQLHPFAGLKAQPQGNSQDEEPPDEITPISRATLSVWAFGTPNTEPTARAAKIAAVPSRGRKIIQVSSVLVV